MAELEPESAAQATAGGSGGGDVRVLDENMLFTMANITRIMKKVLPDGTRITQDAKELVQVSATEFIFFIMSGAHQNFPNTDERRSLTGDDILQAMDLMGFHMYSTLLARYLYKYREWDENQRQMAVWIDGDSDDAQEEDAEITGGAADGDDNPDDMEEEPEIAGDAGMGGGQQRIIGAGNDGDPNRRETEEKEKTDAVMGERQQKQTAGGGDFDFDEDDVLKWLNLDAFESGNGSSG
ncbi:nuclear transcription factor Y subunit B-1-like [Neltuma alba]|uniref:nuclear transcription factor Y subunit B-1-like n=1 Tax=Neltuma alba TaxID=207710 RepID=UPI0010A32953|nr:nuclear transcription factor Y subunit B-1-like [Prosopis alba]